MKEIAEFLTQQGIEFKEYTHPPVFTCEEADKYYVDVPGARPKNLFLRNKKGKQHYLVVLESSKTADLLKIAEIVQDHKLGFASPERLYSYLRTTPGSVSPFGLIFDLENHVKVLVDKDLLQSELVHFHPNDNTKTWLIKGGDLRLFMEKTGNTYESIEI